MAFRLIIKRSASSGSSFMKMINSPSYLKYGLLTDDMLHENDDVKEALRRMPEHLLHERNYRIIRASQLCIQHDELPKNQWTTDEQDVRYLQPFLQQVKEERREREEWESSH